MNVTAATASAQECQPPSMEHMIRATMGEGYDAFARATRYAKNEAALDEGMRKALALSEHPNNPNALQLVEWGKHFWHVMYGKNDEEDDEEA